MNEEYHLCSRVYGRQGDNGAVSEDSNQFGCVPMALIEARVVAVLWPLAHIKLVPNALPPNRII
jgi:inner membrane protease subunit 2